MFFIYPTCYLRTIFNKNHAYYLNKKNFFLYTVKIQGCIFTLNFITSANFERKIKFYFENVYT